MNEPRKIDVLAVGGVDVDLVLKVPELPSFDEKVMGELVGRLPGGTVANFACAASRLGLKVASFANIGDDQKGQAIIEDFQRYSVDTSLIQVVEGHESPFVVILIDPTGESAMVVVKTIDDKYPLDVAANIFSQTRMLYMMPNPRDQFLALAQLAHEHGTEVMVDIESTSVDDRSQLERILKQTDIANFNQDGFKAATGQEPSFEAMRTLLDLGPHTVIVTRGKAGPLTVTANEEAEQAGFEVPVVDTTGAGDTFNAAFLRGTLRGEPLAKRLRFASAAAALSVMALGPRGHLPTPEEVEVFLEECNAN